MSHQLGISRRSQTPSIDPYPGLATGVPKRGNDQDVSTALYVAKDMVHGSLYTFVLQ